MPCFAVDRSLLWELYAELLHVYPGWRVQDVRDLTRSERDYLLDMAYWRLERRAGGG
jgi:hypothetical protein